MYTKKPLLGKSLTPVLTSIAQWGKTVADKKGEIIE